jgi:flagellar protein FlaF
MSLQAYQQAAKRAESPRETEYRLFAQVTLALLEASRADPNDFARRVDALDWNRRMWTVLADACASSENRLPAPLRASIISLSLWVGRHTSAVIRKQEQIEPLIEVNRLVMQGLAPTPSAAAA